MVESTNNEGVLTVNVSQEEITALFGCRSLNDFGGVKGLFHFCGGDEKHATNPKQKCHKIACHWVADIDACR